VGTRHTLSLLQLRTQLRALLLQRTHIRTSGCKCLMQGAVIATCARFNSLQLLVSAIHLLMCTFNLLS
jgi:hypothetical protein